MSGETSGLMGEWDLYREIHKGLRFALFGVTHQAGSTDADDNAAIQSLAAEWHDVAFVLNGHHRHEDEFCDPLVKRYGGGSRSVLDGQHETANQMIELLDVSVRQLAASTPSMRPRLLRSFYLDLADFTAMYLQHLRYEEDVVMPALNASLTYGYLAEVTDQIRASVAPPDMCVFIKYMVPGMNTAERVDMLGGMHRGAPPEIFEQFRAAAQSALPADEYAQLALLAGFG